MQIYNEGQKDYVCNYGTINCKKNGSSVISQMDINNLLLEPEYNFIPTLMNNDEFTATFWEWMEIGKRCFHYNEGFLYDDDGDCVCPTPQMLLGYQIQYIKECMK